MSTTREKLQLSCGCKQNFWLSPVNSLSRVLLDFTLFEYCIRAFCSWHDIYHILPLTILAPTKKKTSTGCSWHGRAKKFCNTATVPSQKLRWYCVLQIQKLLFYSTYNFCMVSYPLSTDSFSLSLQDILFYYIDVLFYCVDILF